MAYQDSTACKLLATQCVICGRALVDARSVELGVGPECRKGVDGGIDDGTRTVVNKLLFAASLAATRGAIEDVLEAADEIDKLGLNEVAGKVRRRFVKAVQRDPDIIVEVEDGQLKVATPFRRGDKQAFIDAWRAIPGRRYHSNRNWVPEGQKRALWALLQRFFPGKYGRGPKGVFRVPVAEEPKPKIVEAEPVVERDEPAPAPAVDPESLPKGQLELNFS